MRSIAARTTDRIVASRTMPRDRVEGEEDEEDEEDEEEGKHPSAKAWQAEVTADDTMQDVVSIIIIMIIATSARPRRRNASAIDPGIISVVPRRDWDRFRRMKTTIAGDDAARDAMASRPDGDRERCPPLTRPQSTTIARNDRHEFSAVSHRTGTRSSTRSRR